MFQNPTSFSSKYTRKVSRPLQTPLLFHPLQGTHCRVPFPEHLQTMAVGGGPRVRGLQLGRTLGSLYWDCGSCFACGSGILLRNKHKGYYRP